MDICPFPSLFYISWKIICYIKRRTETSPSDTEDLSWLLLLWTVAFDLLCTLAGPAHLTYFSFLSKTYLSPPPTPSQVHAILLFSERSHIEWHWFARLQMAIYSTQSQKTEENERNIILSKDKLSSPTKYFPTSKTLKWCKNPPKKSCSKIKWMASFICFRTLMNSLLSQKTKRKDTLVYLSKN